MLHYPVEQTLKLDFRPPAARQPRYPGGKVCEREYVFTCAPDAAPARRYANAAEADNTMFEQQRRRRDAKAERPKSNLRRLEQQRGLCLPKMGSIGVKRIGSFAARAAATCRLYPCPDLTKFLMRKPRLELDGGALK